MASSMQSPKTPQGTCDSENIPPEPLLGAHGPTPPAQNQNVKGKARLSGLQSALTPILKYLNIGNKSPSPLNANSCADFVQNENLPEVTLLDGTLDLTMNSKANAQCDGDTCSPAISEFKKSMNFLDINLNSPFPWIHAETLPEVSLLDETWDTTMIRHPSVTGTPFCKTGTPKSLATQNDMDTKTNTTLPLEKQSLSSTLDIADDCSPPKRLCLESSGINSAKTTKLGINQTLESMSTTFNGNLSHSVSSGIGVTQDFSMSSTLDGSQTKPVAAALPNNMTQDLSISNASDENEMVRSSGRNSKNATFEVTPEEKPKCVSETTPEKKKVTAEPLNNTFSIEPSTLQNHTIEIITSNNNATFEASLEEKPRYISQTTSGNDSVTAEPSTVQKSAVQNQTMEINNSNQCPAKNQHADVSNKQKNLESSPVSNDDCSDSKPSLSCERKNQTFEKNSPQKSSASTNTIVVQASDTSLSLQSTFENKSEENKTGTEPVPPEMSGEPIQATPVSEEKREGTFNVNMKAAAVDISNSEARESLNSGNHLGESFNHNTESRKSGTFILDSSLDFKCASMVTSTPMVTTKSFIFTEELGPGRTTAAQKRLYGEGTSMPGTSASTEVPSNVVSNLKTFLPGAKPNMPSLKPPSLLSKFKPASLLPKRPELVTSGQKATRQNDSSKTNTTQRFQQATISKLPTAYNLRSTAAASSGLKLPVSGLRKPVAGSVSSSLQGASGGLKPPQASKSTSALIPGPGKQPAGTNNLTKNSLPVKRYPLPKSVTVSDAKKKKTDHLLASDKVEASTSSDTAAKVKTLKAPTQRALPSKKHVPSSSPDSATASESSSSVKAAAAGVTILTDSSEKSQCRVCVAKDQEIQRLKEAIELQLKELKDKDEEIIRLKEELAQMTE